MTRFGLRACLLALGCLAIGWQSAAGQGFGEAFSGFSTSSDQPIQIEADRLEVRDEEKLAVYRGNVSVRQGETLLKTTELRVHYSGEGGGAAPGAAVDRIEASGKVLVQSGDQTASGERAVFEMASDTVTLSGNVVLTEGDNVVRGERLVVDLKTKEARIEGGRVQTILTPKRSEGRGGRRE
jgi:lipopolysaccharide export system protein LptA